MEYIPMESLNEFVKIPLVKFLNESLEKFLKKFVDAYLTDFLEKYSLREFLMKLWRNFWQNTDNFVEKSQFFLKKAGEQFVEESMEDFPKEFLK